MARLDVWQGILLGLGLGFLLLMGACIVVFVYRRRVQLSRTKEQPSEECISPEQKIETPQEQSTIGREHVSEPLSLLAPPRDKPSRETLQKEDVEHVYLNPQRPASLSSFTGDHGVRATLTGSDRDNSPRFWTAAKYEMESRSTTPSTAVAVPYRLPSNASFQSNPDNNSQRLQSATNSDWRGPTPPWTHVPNQQTINER